MRYPDSLKPGDKVCILSPAGKIDPAIVYRAAAVLKDWGLIPVIAENALGASGRFSADAEHRLLDFKQALTDPQIRAIFCSRGGYGAIHLVEKIDPGLIRDSAKWLIGYSDITLLHALFTRAGVISLHAPMAAHLAGFPDDEVSLVLKQILFGGRIRYKTDAHPLNRFGDKTGRLVGGNLAVLAGLRGTPYDFDYEGAILFLEDIGESPYKIDRMLYNLRLGGVFDQLKGLIVGQFSDCPEDKGMGNTIYENIRTIVGDYDFPVCFNFPCGHVPFNLPLPEGEKVRLEVTADGMILEFAE